MLIGCGDVFKQVVAGEVDFVAALFKCHTEHLLAFYGSGAVVGVDFYDVVGTFSFGLQYFESFGSEVRGNDAIAHFALDHQGRSQVAGVGECDEVAVGRHTVGTACPGVGGGDR